jgi:hypothetical protein
VLKFAYSKKEPHQMVILRFCRFHPGPRGSETGWSLTLNFTSISNIDVMSKDIATQIDAPYPKPRANNANVTGQKNTTLGFHRER